ncbi:hypothetical protein PC128_g21977 [Phytophthora cactorum]|nr:hypothetical protein PC128_g21977 [Phytophthora cactorum]
MLGPLHETALVWLPRLDTHLFSSRLAKRHDLTVASHKPLALANAPLVEAERELYHNTKPANLTESVTDNGLWAPINAAAIRKAFKLSALYMHQRSFPGVST